MNYRTEDKPMGLHDIAIVALADAHEADPRANHYGFFSRDSFFGGVGMYHWYPSLEALLTGISRDLPWALLGDEPEDVAETSKALAAAINGITKIEDLNQERLKALTEALSSFQDLGWVGKFSDLCSSQSEWAVSMRESYRESIEAEDVAEDSPISEGELDDFVEFLSEYGY